MGLRNSGQGIVVCRGLVRRGVPDRSAERRRGGAVWLGVIAALLAGPGERVTAQTAPRPVNAASVYVPAQCAGARRCPLVVFFQEDEADMARSVVEWQRPLADKYGMILLAPDRLDTMPLASLDTMLQQVLRTYAVDRDKIALTGSRVERIYHDYTQGLSFPVQDWDSSMDQGSSQHFTGYRCADPNVFSRVAMLSPQIGSGLVCPSEGRRQAAVQIYLSVGLAEPWLVLRAPRYAQQLRRDGHTVELSLALRGYKLQPKDLEDMWRWLSDSWAAPVAPVAPAADPGPLLTARALGQLTTFWTRFLQEPDSIRTAARLAHQQRITVPIGTERFSLLMMDTPALAAEHRSVRAALRAAGLTARQADAYRRALIVAAANLATWPTEPAMTPVRAGSRPGRNIAFMRAHKESLKVLGATGMWTTP